MRILVTASPNEGNRYVDELLARLSCHARTYGDRELFWRPNKDITILNIHWPEYLFKSNSISPEDLLHIDRLLSQWKRHSAIVFTRHNSRPHFDAPGRLELYELIAKQADGVIHFGNFSLKEHLRDMIPPVTQLQAVIPHPIYETQPWTRSAIEARYRLGIGKNRVVVCAFGNLRTHKNSQLALDLFSRFRQSRKTLLSSRWKEIPTPSKRRVIKYLTWNYHYLQRKLTKRFILANHFVSDEDVQDYLLSSDIVLVARSFSLNSGVLPLAFTFGKVVVGPEWGNIGEWLKKTGNPTFDPCLTRGERVLDLAWKLSCEGLGEKNRQFALTNWNQQLITEQIVGFFKEVYAHRFKVN